MKQIDIFGIGNALVDIEYQNCSREAGEFDLPKGMMTLVSDSQTRGTAKGYKSQIKGHKTELRGLSCKQSGNRVNAWK